jgi:hypothetical protein
MIARCPHCGTGHALRYRLGHTPEALHCNTCDASFALFPALEIEVAGRPRIPVGLAVEEAGRPPVTLRAGRHDRLGPSPPILLDPRRPLAPAMPPMAASGLRTGAGLMAGLILIAGFVGQILIQERAHLANYPELAAISTLLCQHLPCPEPHWRVPAAIRIDSLHFDGPAEGPLQVEIEVSNTLDRAQAWPLLEMAWSDRYGRILGQGRWAPAAYLGPAIDSPPAHAQHGIRMLAAGEVRWLRLVLHAPTPPPDGITIWPL